MPQPELGGSRAPERKDVDLQVFLADGALQYDHGQTWSAEMTDEAAATVKCSEGTMDESPSRESSCIDAKELRKMREPMVASERSQPRQWRCIQNDRKSSIQQNFLLMTIFSTFFLAAAGQGERDVLCVVMLLLLRLLLEPISCI